MEWQPIETAPKDGEPFDVWDDSEYGQERIADVDKMDFYGNGVCHIHCQTVLGGLRAEQDIFSMVVNPTHWMRAERPQ